MQASYAALRRCRLLPTYTRLRPAYAGQQRRFDGLAAAIMEYWERNEIVKISCRAVINANLVKTAKAIQVRLLRDFLEILA